MKVYCSYHYFDHPKIFLENPVSQSFTTENQLFSSYINNLYLYFVWISALFCCAAQLRPLAGNRLRPQTEVVFLASAAVMSTYVSMCQRIYWSDVNITWLSKSRSAAQLTEWCLATSGLTRHECYHPLVLLAAMLTLLLAHIPPLSGCYIVYILSQDCFGRFS